MYITIHCKVPAILPANGAQLAGCQPHPCRHTLPAGFKITQPLLKTNNHQSQLDTERQGVLRNIWLTSTRLLIAAAITICLNMIIKVNKFVWKLQENMKN